MEGGREAGREGVREGGREEGTEGWREGGREEGREERLFNVSSWATNYILLTLVEMPQLRV